MTRAEEVVVVSVLIDVLSWSLHDHQGDHALLDHDKLGEVLSNADDLVLRKIQPRVDVAQEVASELTAAFKLLIVEQVEEVGDKVAKQAVDQPLSDSRLQLNEELVILDLVIIIVIGLLSVILDGVVELLTEVLGPALLQLS